MKLANGQLHQITDPSRFGKYAEQSRWQSCLANCDNLAVVEVINAGYNKDSILIQLLCASSLS